MKVWAFLAAAMVATAAVAAPVPSAPFSGAQRVAARAQAAKARSALDLRLLDYSTARFRDVQALRSTTDPEIKIRFCGLVNSKNQVGGYTGWTRFIALGNDVYVEGGPSPEYLMLCESADQSADTVDYSSELVFRP